MEFCEKSTLRDYINAGLCHDVSRVWQLFREIVEGLAHIHEQVSVFNCTSMAEWQNITSVADNISRNLKKKLLRTFYAVHFHSVLMSFYSFKK